MYYLLGLPLNLDPPDRCLLGRLVYRCEPLAPGLFMDFFFEFFKIVKLFSKIDF
jgi:hypothetical protein